MRVYLGIFCLVVVFALSTAARPTNPYTPSPQPPPECGENLRAVCRLRNGSVEGDIYLQEQSPSAPVNLTGQISGLNPGLHGFHVHQYGDLSNGCVSAGGHYNPFNREHGAPSDNNRHVGDLGNIEANQGGVAPINISDGQLRLCGPLSIMGRAIVVHRDRDDLGQGGNEESRRTGNAGPRLGCCVIGVAASS